MFKQIQLIISFLQEFFNGFIQIFMLLQKSIAECLFSALLTSYPLEI